MESSSSKLKKLFTAKNTDADDWKETFKTIIYAIVFAVMFRSFAYEPFHIPSGSMKSNLLIGDYLFVSKFSYGYSRYSLPYVFKLLPFHGRIFRSVPQRGDVVVFHPPGLPPLGDSFIKRLIGLPGDHIQMKDGVLYINDKAVKKEPVDDWVDRDKEGEGAVLHRFRETLPEGKEYLMLNAEMPSAVENTGVYTVPEGHYFMMGDNRDNSRDSRFPDPVGYVPEENIIGRADLVLFSWSCGFICPDRLFMRINK